MDPHLERRKQAGTGSPLVQGYPANKGAEPVPPSGRAACAARCVRLGRGCGHRGLFHHCSQPAGPPALTPAVTLDAGAEREGRAASPLLPGSVLLPESCAPLSPLLWVGVPFPLPPATGSCPPCWPAPLSPCPALCPCLCPFCPLSTCCLPTPGLLRTQL